MRAREFEIALSTFENLRERFPALSMNLDSRPSNMDVAMYIPAQAGLSFKVHLNLRAEFPETPRFNKKRGFATVVRAIRQVPATTYQRQH
ncbi:MAG: hypothetical protein WA715_12575 [Candidatus Acidiferrum sp.]|jgi:hypothetical protein